MSKFSRAVGVFALYGAVLHLLGDFARADQRQNAAVSGDTATLTANGFGNFGALGPLNGELVTVGVIEAQGGLANTSGVINTSPN